MEKKSPGKKSKKVILPDLTPRLMIPNLKFKEGGECK